MWFDFSADGVRRRFHTVLGLLAGALLLPGCALLSAPPQPLNVAQEVPPIRFLLSFDDGPSLAARANPTREVLDRLADNRVQPGIKALFFVQTGAIRGPAAPLATALLSREHAEGHVLGFHTATPGHTSHTRLKADALDASLAQGLDDHRRLFGAAPRLVRPPHWRYDARSFAAYARHGLALLMTDLSANDGKIPWPDFSLRRRAHFQHQLDALSERLEELPVVAGVRPVIVTFHDPNAFTAAHLEEYLQILVQGAARAGLPLDPRPFYADGAELEAAALARSLPDARRQRVPGFWTSLWHWLLPRDERRLAELVRRRAHTVAALPNGPAVD